MAKVSEYFNLQKTQAELDFVNVEVFGDNSLFIDPFAISQRLDPLGRACNSAVIEFFARIVEAIRIGNEQIALELLSHLREPNETRLGYSMNEPRGAGIGKDQSHDLFLALKDSSAIRTGFISSLQECELVIPGIDRDKISDLTTNIIRGHLCDYTFKQCDLLGIPTQMTPLPPVFNEEQNQWESQYHNIPLVEGQPLLLVPKVFVRFIPAYNHVKYYRHYVLDYLRAEALSASNSLVKTLKNGNRVVYKKDVEAKFPCTKGFLYDFSREHPEVLGEYRADLEEIERSGPLVEVTVEEEATIARALLQVLQSIRSGPENASTYHSLMIGVLEFLFFPNLLNPEKEREIHEGRKRIDIVMENGARIGIFSRLHQIRHIPCPFIAFECKNYGREVSNPELDQLTGRFSPRRGKVGFLCCRGFRNRNLFIQRCRDTFSDDRGLAIPLDDDFFIKALAAVEGKNRGGIDSMLTDAINEVAFS